MLSVWQDTRYGEGLVLTMGRLMSCLLVRAESIPWLRLRETSTISVVTRGSVSEVTLTGDLLRDVLDPSNMWQHMEDDRQLSGMCPTRLLVDA